MKIAIVSEGFRPYVGGVETRYTKLAEQLSKRHDVHVLTLLQNASSPDGGEVPLEEDCGKFRVTRIRVSGKYFLVDGTRSFKGVREFSRRCVETLNEGDYDAVLASEWPLIHILDLRKKTNYRILIDWHEVWGRYYLRFGLKGLGGYILEKIIAGLRGVRHLAVSEFTRDRLRKVLGVRDDIPVIWNGIDPSEYGELSGVKREFGKIVFFGRFAPHKGIDLLIEAFRLVNEDQPDSSLHIIGDGPLRDQIVKLASKVEGVYVHLALPRRRLLEHIKSAWIAVIPSSREGHGISYLEAMAAGTPVISARSQHNAFSCMVKDGEEAMVVERGPSKLAEAMLKLLRDEDLWRRLSMNGERLAFRYTWSEMALRLEDVLNDVAEAGS